MSTARKAPAFQFYADDFLSGTMTFSHEQRGLYITLLCLQWSQGSVRVEDARELAGRMNPERLARVLAKFVDDGQGNLKNPRLERERTKQNEFRDAKSEAGRLGNAKRWHTHRTATTAASHSDGGEVADSLADSIANGRFPSPSPYIGGKPPITPAPSAQERGPWEVALGLDLPETLRTEACLFWVRKWVAHRREIRKPVKPTMLQTQLNRWAQLHPPEKLAQLIEANIANGYQGVHELGGGQKNGAAAGKVGPGSMATENAAGTTAQAVVRVVGKD